MTARIYLQIGFWEILSSDTSREGIRSMLNVSDALSNSDVITDVPEERLSKDIFLMAMIKQGNYHRCDSTYINKKIEGLCASTPIEDLCATYMLDKKPFECDRVEKKYGVVAICASSLPAKKFLFDGDGFSLDKNKRYPLKYMAFKEQLQHPNNSMIVIDPYLLKTKDVDKVNNTIVFPGILNNLEPLLDAMLPQKLDVDYHLTIISSLDNPNDLRTAYEKVRKCLKRKRKELNVRLSMIYTAIGYHYWTESFHSRHVITNSFAVDSEDGMDLFNEKGYLTKNNPTISIVFPRLFGDSRQDVTKYNNWIKSVKQYVEDCSDKEWFGTKENRLFDLAN